MRNKIAGAELLLLPKGSHAGLVEHPELLNLRVEKFLREQVEPFLRSHGGVVRVRAAAVRGAAHRHGWPLARRQPQRPCTASRPFADRAFRIVEAHHDDASRAVLL
jgi:hypothetical protein